MNYDLFNQQPSFHNTCDLQGYELSRNESKAKTLEAFILEHVLVEGVEYSPYDVLEKCHELGFKTKETSVRRALTNMRKAVLARIVYTGNSVINLKYSDVQNKTIRLK